MGKFISGKLVVFSYLPYWQIHSAEQIGCALKLFEVCKNSTLTKLTFMGVWNITITLLYMSTVEPHLSEPQLTGCSDYPASNSTYSN